MIYNRNVAADAAIDASKIAGGGGGGSGLGARKTYYVDRNTGSSGDGLSWDNAFLTITEAVAAVNADYTAGASNGTSKGRMRRIVVGEGWYSEVGMTLTASDVEIVGTASGSGIADGTVLYGSATAGGWDAGAVVPALTITGSSVSVSGMGFVNSASGLYAAVSVGSSGSSGPTDVGFFNCFWPRNTADMYTYGLMDYGNEGMRVENCYFSQSAKTGGILIASNGSVNPVNDWIHNCIFVGTPVGIHQTAGHNTHIKGCSFFDATDDRNDTIDNPINIVATSGYAWMNFAPSNTLAEFDAGSVAINKGNFCSDSDSSDWPSMTNA